MSKEDSALFLLVKRMNKSEKRHFKLMASRQQSGASMFIRLFDQLDSMKNYDPGKLGEQFTGIKPAQLPNQKVFLYNYLLGCLRLSTAPVSIDIELDQLVNNARILYDKCLYHDCIRHIEKAKRFAEKNDRLTRLFEILDLEKQVTPHTVAVRHEERVNRTTKYSNGILSQVGKVNRFQNLSTRMNVFYVQKGFIRNSSDLLVIKKIFNAHFPGYPVEELSFVGKLHYYHALTGYYFFIQDFRNGYATAKKWVRLFDAEPGKVAVHTELYIRAVNSLLVVQNKLGLLEEFEQTHRGLVAIKRLPKARWSDNIHLNLFKAIYVHEINRHFMRGEFRAGVRIVAKLENELVRFIPLLDHHSVLIFYYKIACLYFGADQFKRALHWLNRIIFARDIAVREDLHTFARILALICHYELGNERLAAAHIISLYRFLLKKGDFSKYNRLILGFLRKLHRNLSQRKMIRMYSELRTNLLPLTKQKFEKRSFLYFDIISWLESKVSGRNVEDVIRSKVKAGKV